MDYSLGPLIEGSHHYALLEHVVTEYAPQGVAVEFGVGKGESTRILAQHMPVIGFDSFAGLPEDWRDGYPKGSFAHTPPAINNVRLVVGWFDVTLPGFSFPDVGLVHFDADLYSSTATALEFVGPHLKAGTIVVFDEWFGYEGCSEHEQRAWREFADTTNIQWQVIGHGHHESWSIQIV